jgi:hypothetical protein
MSEKEQLTPTHSHPHRRLYFHIAHIQHNLQLNQQDINNLAIEYIKLPEPARALTLMLEYSSRFDSVELLKHLQE